MTKEQIIENLRVAIHGATTPEACVAVLARFRFDLNKGVKYNSLSELPYIEAENLFSLGGPFGLATLGNDWFLIIGKGNGGAVFKRTNP